MPPIMNSSKNHDVRKRNIIFVQLVKQISINTKHCYNDGFRKTLWGKAKTI